MASRASRRWVVASAIDVIRDVVVDDQPTDRPTAPRSSCPSAQATRRCAQPRRGTHHVRWPRSTREGPDTSLTVPRSERAGLTGPQTRTLEHLSGETVILHCIAIARVADESGIPRTVEMAPKIPSMSCVAAPGTRAPCVGPLEASRAAKSAIASLNAYGDEITGLRIEESLTSLQRRSPARLRPGEAIRANREEIRAKEDG